MANTVRNLVQPVKDALVAASNASRLDELKLRAGLIFHADASTTITIADATDLASSITLVNAVKASYNAHCASACNAVTGIGCHIVADATYPTAVADATDLTSVEALANDIKTKYTSHRAATANHAVADSTNTISSANATDQATSNTLVNELKAKLNLHYAGAMTSPAILVVPA